MQTIWFECWDAKGGRMRRAFSNFDPTSLVPKDVLEMGALIFEIEVGDDDEVLKITVHPHGERFKVYSKVSPSYPIEFIVMQPERIETGKRVPKILDPFLGAREDISVTEVLAHLPDDSP